jgi:hypothetical protein
VDRRSDVHENEEVIKNEEVIVDGNEESIVEGSEEVIVGTNLCSTNEMGTYNRETVVKEAIV